MDAIVLKHWFEDMDGAEFLKFSRIPESDRLHPSMEVCGILKIASLLTDPSKCDMSAEHDVLYLPNAAEFVATMTIDDAIYLSRCGIMWESQFDCFYMFT